MVNAVLGAFVLMFLVDVVIFAIFYWHKKSAKRIIVLLVLYILSMCEFTRFLQCNYFCVINKNFAGPLLMMYFFAPWMVENVIHSIWQIFKKIKLK